ncbi:helix-turn-helix transcriptional regulator [uncultured Bacteroides sp.]|uniref:helix-turn-helix domain-containing protein n=1 Tax=uncultured Bacteroides sp. TaxID=162156 RepID=UPI002AAABBA1|nr:helix-turn-helix transcriptional regulator [uncultured Bacteroides sp.]
MNDSERLKFVIDGSGLSVRAFAKYIGVSTPQNLYDVLKGKHAISKKLAEAINVKYLNASISWLLTGIGDNPEVENVSNISAIIDECQNDNIVMSRDVFELLKSQSETITSQQKTIESLAISNEKVVSYLKEKEDNKSNI